MSKLRSQLVEDHFLRVSDLDAPSRQRYFEEHCRDEPELRAEVEALLQHAVLAKSNFLEGGERALSNWLLTEGSVFARYRIVRPLGRGGMGEVYEALQDQPQRRVALKLVRGDRAGEGALRRFRVECEILGQLNHPGIAQVLEAGSAPLPAGPRDVSQPYLALELVRGSQLVDYAEEKKLSPRSKLELLARICDAVAHAHEHGVIHRDLKPANVLVVEERDENGASRGQPKLVDFGVARVQGPLADGLSHETLDGQVLGTLAYMSPEQMAGGSTAVDTRTDVFALGVMAYELLAGRGPHDIAGMGLSDAIVELRERTPPRLGERIPALRGDVETIVARAMERDRTRRYASADALGADIRRHLRGEPIEARSDSRAYVLRTLFRRHWRFGAAASTAVGLLLAFALYSYDQAQRTARLASSLSAANANAVAQLDKASAARIEAEQVNSMVLRLFESADVQRTEDADLRVRDLLDAFTSEVEAELSTQSAVLARVLETVARANKSIARPEVAAAQFRRAIALRRELVPPDLHELARLQIALGGALADAQDPAAAFRELDKGTELHARSGEACRGCVSDAFVLRARLHRLADRPRHALAALEEAEAALGCGQDAPPRALASLRLAQGELAANQADLADAQSRFSEAATLLRTMPGARQADLHGVLTSSALVMRRLRRFEEAESLVREALLAQLASHGFEHPGLARSFNTLGLIVLDRGDVDQSEALFLQALDLLRDAPSARDLRTIVRSNLALCLVRRGALDEALALREAICAERRSSHGADSRLLAVELASLGALLYSKGRFADAEARYREAIDIHRRLGGEHIELGNALLGRGLQLERLRRLDEALVDFEESLTLHERYLGEHLLTFRSTRKVAEVLAALGRHVEAVSMFERGHELARIPTVGDASDEGAMATKWAMSLIELGRHAEVEPIERLALEAWRRARGEAHVDVAQALCNLGVSLHALGRDDEAIAVLRDSAVLFERVTQDVARRSLPLAWIAVCVARGERSSADDDLLAAAAVADGDSVAVSRRRRLFEAVAARLEFLGEAAQAAAWRQRAGR